MIKTFWFFYIQTAGIQQRQEFCRVHRHGKLSGTQVPRIHQRVKQSVTVQLVATIIFYKKEVFLPQFLHGETFDSYEWYVYNRDVATSCKEMEKSFHCVNLHFPKKLRCRSLKRGRGRADPVVIEQHDALQIHSLQFFSFNQSLV